MTDEYIGIAAVIFDRDGVLIEDTGFPHKPEHLRWMPGALEALRWLQQRGILALVATNQSGVARGYFTEVDVEGFHRLMQKGVVDAGGHIDAFAVCPHLPDATVDRYRVDCDCRKPRSGLVRMLLERFGIVPQRALLIGDRERDIQAGEGAGVRGFLYQGGDLLAFLQRAMAHTVRGAADRPTLRLAGLGMNRVAGITEARIIHPLEEMRWLGDNLIIHGAGGVEPPSDWPDGILILQRQFLTQTKFNEGLERLVARGWTLVLEIDDDPHHWPAYVESGFHAFRAVHAVSVSTPALAHMARQWNPEVAVFPNAIDRLPDQISRLPATGEPLRVFFGALNRESDWAPVVPVIRTALESSELGDRLRFVVVHDDAFARALAPWVVEAYPTLPLQDYRRCLASCHLALLPLADTHFNRMKSDLKLVECLAHGVLPVCSPVIYAEHPAHRNLVRFAATPEEWVAGLAEACASQDDMASERQAGRAYVARERMHWQQAIVRDAWYRGLLQRRPALERERLDRLRRLPLRS